MELVSSGTRLTLATSSPAFTSTFLPFLGTSDLHPGNLSKASRSLLRTACPKVWPHHKAQPQKEDSIGLSPIRVEILACTADKKFLASHIFCILQREQDWVDRICSKGESSACAVLFKAQQCLALNPPNNNISL